MFNEEILLEFSGSDQFTSVLIRVFYDNLKLTNAMLSKYHYYNLEYDDLFQLAWDSFNDAVSVWIAQNQRYPLQAYYRTCLKHTIYKETRESVKYESILDRAITNETDRCYNLEQDVLNYELWLVVQQILPARNFEIIVQRFYFEKTLKEIGDYFNVSYETIRKSIKSSCKILKSNKEIKDIGRMSGYRV